MWLLLLNQRHFISLGLDVCVLEFHEGFYADYQWQHIFLHENCQILKLPKVVE